MKEDLSYPGISLLHCTYRCEPASFVKIFDGELEKDKVTGKFIGSGVVGCVVGRPVIDRYLYYDGLHYALF